MKELVIVVSEGMVTQVYFTEPINELTIIDFDTTDEDEYQEATDALNKVKALEANFKINKIY